MGVRGRDNHKFLPFGVFQSYHLSNFRDNFRVFQGFTVVMVRQFDQSNSLKLGDLLGKFLRSVKFLELNFFVNFVYNSFFGESQILVHYHMVN